MNDVILDKQQEQLVKSSSSKHALVIAGPGSGKTRCIISIALKYHKNKKNSALVLTYSNKAANELQTRIRNKDDSFKSVFSFHALAYKYLLEDKLSGRRVEPDQSKVAKELGIDVGPINNFHNGMIGINQLNMLEYKAYKEYYKTNNLTDFPYMLYNFCQNLDDIQFIKKVLCDIDVVTIDEGQDMNGTKAAILMKFVKHGIRLFVVGDPNQSIYSWRGSDIKYMLDFKEYFGEHETYYLNGNYRSNKTIVNFANYIISIGENKIPNPMISKSDSVDNQIHIHYCKQEMKQVALIAKNLLEAHPNKSIGILSRTNALIPHITHELDQLSINTNDNFTHHKEFNILILYLQLCRDFTVKNLCKLASVESIGMGKTTLKKLSDYEDVKEGLRRLKKGKFVKLVESWQSLSGKDLLMSIIDKSIRLRGKLGEHNSLVKKMITCYEDCKSLEEFEVKGVSSISNTNVSVMTIHKSKGLEFDSVIMPNVTDKSSDTPQEERRIFFVGISRAKRELHLTFGGDYSSSSFGASRFIHNLPLKELNIKFHYIKL